MEKGKGYSEEKMKRLAVAGTVAGVLLIVFLLAILIVQFVQIGVKKAEISSYEAEIEAYRQSITSEERELDAYLNGDALYYRALKQGWTSP